MGKEASGDQQGYFLHGARILEDEGVNVSPG
jgi:hypothetical protein